MAERRRDPGVLRIGRFCRKGRRRVPEPKGHLVGMPAQVEEEARGYRDRLERLLEKRTKELQRSETNLQLLIRSMVDGVMVIDEEGMVRFANPAAEAMVGCQEGRLLGSRLGYPVAPSMAEVKVGLSDEGMRTLELRTVPVEWGGRSAQLTSLRDVTERKEAEARLESLSRRLLEAQESERRAVGQELHDAVGGTLTILKLTLEQARRKPGAEPEPVLAQIGALADEVLEQVRELSHSLRPPMLDDLGLLPALLWHFERYSAQTRMHIDFSHSGLDCPVPRQVSTTAFRIVQEALTNVVRHAGVDQVNVTAWVEGTALWVRIEDQGKGFDESAAGMQPSMGLLSMHERARLLGGKLTIQSARGMGTTVLAELPVDGGLERQG